MTPQDLDDARRIAADALRIPHRVDTIGILAHAVLALTEQQPEPVSRDEIDKLITRWWTSELGISNLTSMLLSGYTITARPAVSSPDGDSDA